MDVDNSSTLASQSSGPGIASNACAACKRQKRKCDKKLPKCSLCARMARDCIYTETVQNPEDAVEVLRSRVGELEALLFQRHHMMEELQAREATSIKPPACIYNPSARLVNANLFEGFPAMFFLDNEMFRESRITIPKPSAPVPDEVYTILGTVDGLRNIADRFFSTTHTWFPILSRKRCEIMLSDPFFRPSPDLALLFAAMHLITDEGSNCRGSTLNNVYWTVKNYAVVLEANAVLTPQFLQANILVALYEIGHAIYPAAYLSVGKCATYGRAMGIDNRRDAPQMLRRYGAWAELEEIRRLWWAVRVLDRYVHLGLTGHILSTEDPFQNEVLPANDAQFDQAEMASSEPLYVRSPTSIPASPFARTCQAAHLVGKVETLLNDIAQEMPTRFTDALQVYRTLTAYATVVRAEFDEFPANFATPMALAYSGLMALCDPFCCTESNRGAHTVEETELQIVCIAGIKSVADEIARFATFLRASMHQNPAAISPLLGNCLYMGTATFCWRVYEGEETCTVEAYRLCRDALSALNGRWAVGGQYIEAVDKGKELLYPTPLLS